MGKEGFKKPVLKEVGVDVLEFFLRFLYPPLFCDWTDEPVEMDPQAKFPPGIYIVKFK